MDLILEKQTAFRVPEGSSKSNASKRWQLRPLAQVSPGDMKAKGWMPGSLVAVSDIDTEVALGACEIWPSRHVAEGRVRVSSHLRTSGLFERLGGRTSTKHRRGPFVRLELMETPDKRPSDMWVPDADVIEVVLVPKTVVPTRDLTSSKLISTYVKGTLRRRCPYVVVGCVLTISVMGSSCRLCVRRAVSGDDKSLGSGLYRMTDRTVVRLIWSEIEVLSAKEDGDDDANVDEATATTTTTLVGGLDEQLREIKAIIEIPLKRSNHFDDNGATPPRGVLMYGSPGTGKTLIARAVARECETSFVVVNGPEIVGRWVGESERMLRNVFEEAKAKRPCVIFFDEIDALCPSRERHAASEFEKRLVSALLTEIDTMPTQVVVLAATNRRHALDPALRRPGRIDREVEIPVPSRDGRAAILRVILNSMNQRPPESAIEAAADCTHGCVGADLRSLCRIAGLRALRRALVEDETSSSSSCAVATIGAHDLAAAASATRPSALREITVQVPHVRWSDIGGQDDVKRVVRETIEWPLRHADAFQRMGIQPPRGVLLYGPPGCAKTLMAKAMATESSMNFVAVKGPELFSKWVGESERAVQELFAKARRSAPTIVFFDEIDALAVQRGSSGDGGTSVADRVLSQLLQEIDGIDPMRQVVVVAATNRPDVIDSALLRPGRIDRLLYVAPPDREAREKILRIHLRKTPLDDDVRLDDVAESTKGYSGAEIAAICREASLIAMQESVDIKAVCAKHFDAALRAVQPQITPEMIRFYEAFSGRSEKDGASWEEKEGDSK